MTMTLDSQQRYGPLSFSHLSAYQSSSGAPHFSNPWGPSSSSAHYAVNSQGLAPLSLDRQSRTSNSSNASSLASYGAIPVSAPSSDLLSLSRMQTTSAAYGEPAYTTAASPVSATYAASSTPYDTLGYAPAPMRSTFALAPEAEHSRRFSQTGMAGDDRRGFADALDASHGMLAMSQETPRNIYGSRSDRGSGDSYGFPSTHSTHSSISSSGGNFSSSSYYGDSVSDYSTAGSDIESVTSRTLPRPSNIMGSVPPAPQSMMSQFSSKVSTGTQKKHKCKVCDKRFTRPSSLQTHMYSHTGEKPFACEVDGCGRHFSVVSNLRRHRKVHKSDCRSEAGSEDHHSD